MNFYISFFFVCLSFRSFFLIVCLLSLFSLYFLYLSLFVYIFSAFLLSLSLVLFCFSLICFFSFSVLFYPFIFYVLDFLFCPLISFCWFPPQLFYVFVCGGLTPWTELSWLILSPVLSLVPRSGRQACNNQAVGGGGELGKGGGAWGGGERADNGLENSAKRRMSPAWSILMHW